MAVKKSFPGIFVIIVITFAIYLTIVVGFIYMHYKKPSDKASSKKIVVSVPAQLNRVLPENAASQPDRIA